MTRINSIRMVLAIATLKDLEVHQMDVKTTFLNEDLNEEIYMEQPEGFSAPGQEMKVCRLVKSMYGLNKYQNNGMRNLTTLCCHMDSKSMNVTSVSMPKMMNIAMSLYVCT